MKSESVFPKHFWSFLYCSEALEKAKNEIEGDIEENKEAIEELKKWQTEIKKDKETICEVFKVGCVSPMVISSKFRIGQYWDDNHWEDAPQFTMGDLSRSRSGSWPRIGLEQFSKRVEIGRFLGPDDLNLPKKPMPIEAAHFTRQNIRPLVN